MRDGGKPLYGPRVWQAPETGPAKGETGLTRTASEPARGWPGLGASGPAAIGLLLISALLLAGCAGRDRRPATPPATVTSIAVNSYLWRAALETMQFMPLAQVDSAGGVIVGDWYQTPAVPNERVRVTVAILDGALRADAVQVSAAREVFEGGRWTGAPLRAGTVQRLEEIILERARAMRQAELARN